MWWFSLHPVSAFSELHQSWNRMIIHNILKPCLASHDSLLRGCILSIHSNMMHRFSFNNVLHSYTKLFYLKNDGWKWKGVQAALSEVVKWCCLRRFTFTTNKICNMIDLRDDGRQKMVHLLLEFTVNDYIFCKSKFLKFMWFMAVFNYASVFKQQHYLLDYFRLLH